MCSDWTCVALQASNAYWSKEYYTPYRYTLTLPLMFWTRAALREELLLLQYIAAHTHRDIVLPNLLLGLLPHWCMSCV